MVRGSLGRPFLAPPSVAIWFRRLTLLLFAALSLLLLPRTDARAQSPTQTPLVTIQTRVVSGGGPNPYSTQVGNTTYSATGTGPGYHVVALNRATLALVLNNTYGLNLTSINSMIGDIGGLGSNVLVVISSMGPASSIDSSQIASLTTMIQNLGGTGQLYLFGGTMSPVAYSLIGIPGLGAAGGAATQVGTYADPDTDGNIAGVLIPDVNGNYAFVYSKFVKIQTSAGLNNDTIIFRKISGKKVTFQAPPLPVGAQGGFHVLIVKRTTIDRIATDSTVVLLHASYATNSSIGASETHRMASDLAQFPNGLATGNLIYIIASLGSNPNLTVTTSTLPDLSSITATISQLGGAGDLASLGSKGFYSIIGIPNSGSGTLSPEVRSYATPVLSANITAVLQQNNVGVFTPVAASAAAGATLDLSLYPTALAPPSPWPVAPHGSDAVCPAGAQQCAAYKWISAQLICGLNPPTCANEDIRGEYANLNFTSGLNVALVDGLTYPSQPTTQPAVPFFGKQAFIAVKEQLANEIAFVLDVRALFANFNDVVTDLAIGESSMLANAYTQVEKDVQPDTSAATALKVLGVVRDALMVAQVVVGVVNPLAAAPIALGNAAIYIALQVNKAPSGADGNDIVATEGALFQQIGDAFTAGLAGNGQMETIVLSDWNKLNTIGTKIEDANSSSSGPWFWGPTNTSDTVNALTNAFTVSFYQTLMASKYQMVAFNGVPFSNPSSYEYNFDCQTSMGVKLCACSGQVYSPPASDLFNFGSNILMAISPSDGSYPSTALTNKLFNTMHLYSPDFFFTVRGWSTIAGTLPQGWSDYLANGACFGSASHTPPRPGVPNPAAPHHP